MNVDQTDRYPFLKSELEWIRQSPRARATKSKARITAFHALIESSLESREELPALSIPPGKRLGDRVVRADGIAKSYGGRPLMRDLSFELPPGGIVGVIGPNGAGKTTLLRIIAGEVEPDAGHLDVGPTVEICFVDQGRKELEDEQSVYQEVSEGHDTFRVGRREVNARAYLSRFGFRGEGQEKRVKDLSGGERNRVQMAKMLRRGGNLILLDEPTNDLDIPTLRLLEEALQAFPGCAVVVSHDRYFLDRVATHILAFEGEGRARLFEGSYEAYSRRVAAERRERGEPEEPARGAHRRFR
ncbi:MAG: ATP-binding cassette domain-containing protein [Planctomycetota bacterium]